MPDLTPGVSPQRAEFELAVLRAVAGLVPGCLPDRIRATIEVEKEGVVLKIIIPPERTLAAAAWVAPPDDATPAPRRREPVLNEMERDILQAVGEGQGAVMTGEQIAERAGYECDSVFRGCLAGLRRRGLLGGEPGARGYTAVKPALPA